MASSDSPDADGIKASYQLSTHYGGKRLSLAVVASVIAITVVLSSILPGLEIDTSMDRYLPHQEKYSTFNRIEGDFGSEPARMVVYVAANNEQDSVLTPGAIREEYDLGRRLASVDGVDGVLSAALVLDTASREFLGTGGIDNMTDEEINNIVTMFFAYLRGDLDMNLSGVSPYLANRTLLKKTVSSLFSVDLSFQHPMPHATIIICYYNDSIDRKGEERITSEIVDIVGGSHYSEIHVESTGMPQITYEINRETTDNIKLLGSISLISVLVMLVIAFRGIKLALAGLLSIVVSVIWTMSSLVLLDYPITTVDVVIVPVIVGLGIDYTIHIIKRLYPSAGRPRVMTANLRQSLPPLTTAMLTTTMAFVTNMASDLTPIRELGVALALGIVYSYILAMTFIPALMNLMDPRKRLITVNTEEAIKYGIIKSSRAVRRFPLASVFVFAVILLPAIWGAANVSSDFTVDEFLPDDWESLETRNRLVNEFSGADYSTVYILIEGDIYDPAVLNYTMSVIKRCSDDHNVINIRGEIGVESIFTYYQLLSYADPVNYSAIDSDGDLIPDSRAAAVEAWSLIRSMNITDPILHKSVSSRASGIYRPEIHAMVVKVYYEMVDASDARLISREVSEDIASPPGNVTVTYTGYAFFILDTMDAIKDAQVRSTVIAILFSSLVLLYMYRSSLLTLASLVPVAVSTVLLMGTMYYMGMSFNILTASVLALTIGLGIDYSVYIIYELKSLVSRLDYPSVDAYLLLVYSKLGTTLYFSAATTFTGFFILILSPLPIIRSYGLLVSLAILYSIVSSLVIVPVLAGIWMVKRHGKTWTGLKAGELAREIKDQILGSEK